MKSVGNEVWWDVREHAQDLVRYLPLRLVLADITNLQGVVDPAVVNIVAREVALPVIRQVKDQVLSDSDVAPPIVKVYY